jgi:cytochrome oxidase Cu insertion factor (SCO1/SenC/PrrC family)
MNERTGKTIWLVWGGLLLLVTLLMVGLLLQIRSRASPRVALPVLGQVADFALTNQAGRAVSLADLRGHVWLGDIIFTRCAGPCPKMTRQMNELEKALPAGSDTKLVTLTTDPEYDTPNVLKKYGADYGADPDRWMFLTGTKSEIRKLGVDSLKLSAVENKPGEREDPNDLFIHATYFVLVDRHGQLRGVFQTAGEGIDPKQVQAEIVTQLEREK